MVLQESWNGFTNSYNMMIILPYRDFGLINQAIFLYEFVQGIQFLKLVTAIFCRF